MPIDQNNMQADPSVEPDTEEYEYLLDDYTHFAPPAEGELLQGRVVKITSKEAIIDFGYKSEGLVPIEQFLDPAGQLTIKSGDVVDVMVDHGESQEGYVLLSHRKAARMRVWDNLERAFQEQLIV